ncbi:MAG: DUF3995 domain-containing protein [Crocinitomicaceae bacterium]
MIFLIASILCLTFFFISGLHFYWCIGGKWGLKAAIPAKNDNIKVEIPGVLATVIVATGLLLFGLFYFNLSILKFVSIPSILEKVIQWFIPSVFILRAVGDFKYAGLFRKIKHTYFAKKDQIIFTPLCLLIGIFGLLLISLN